MYDCGRIDVFLQSFCENTMQRRKYLRAVSQEGVIRVLQVFLNCVAFNEQSINIALMPALKLRNPIVTAHVRVSGDILLINFARIVYFKII